MVLITIVNGVINQPISLGGPHCRYPRAFVWVGNQSQVKLEKARDEGWEWPFQPAWSMYSADPKGRIFRKKMRNLWISRKPIETCMERDYVPYVFCWKIMFFHTCQVRVVRFYQSCSSPPPSLLLLLLHHLCLHFHVHFRLANSSPSSSPTSARSWGTAGPQLQGSERTGHRWTSTWDLPSSVSTAGPQPGTVRAQWAPLDLNLDPPSSVSTAGPQPGTSELSEHRWTSTAR